MENQFREDGFIPKHGGYENLITFQKADIIFHGTKFFCHKYISKFDRTFDQMIQAARSGKITHYMLTQQLKRLEADFLQEGGLRERMTKARMDYRNKKK